MKRIIGILTLSCLLFSACGKDEILQEENEKKTEERDFKVELSYVFIDYQRFISKSVQNLCKCPYKQKRQPRVEAS